MEGSGDFEDVTCGDDGVSSGLVDFSVAVTESDNSGERKRVISDGENTTSLLPPSLNSMCVCVCVFSIGLVLLQLNYLVPT